MNDGDRLCRTIPPAVSDSCDGSRRSKENQRATSDDSCRFLFTRRFQHSSLYFPKTRICTDDSRDKSEVFRNALRITAFNTLPVPALQHRIRSPQSLR